MKATSIVLPKKVKQSKACHPERSEGSLQLCFRTAGMLRFAQHDSWRLACFTYLRNAPLDIISPRSQRQNRSVKQLSWRAMRWRQRIAASRP